MYVHVRKCIVILQVLYIWRFPTGCPPRADTVDIEILQHFRKSSPSLSVPLEPRWSEPVSSHTVCTAACTEYSSVLYL